MNPNDPNVALLQIVAGQLGESLCDDLVFVGGSIAGLLITDPAMPTIRATEDVDLICHAMGLADYHRIEERLRERNFVQDMLPDAPVCRWRTAAVHSAVAVDVMPTLESILGFSNRWYPLALSSAVHVTLPDGRSIRLIAAPVFVATKLEAFDGRGKGDFLSSHDLEDLLAVVDGRAELLDECRASPLELRDYLAARFSRLLATPAFMDVLVAHLPGDPASQLRLPELKEKLRQIAGMDQA